MKALLKLGRVLRGWSVGGIVGVYCYAREQTDRAGVRSFFVAKSGRLLHCILKSQRRPDLG